jgi:hypothetical protein
MNTTSFKIVKDKLRQHKTYYLPMATEQKKGKNVRLYILETDEPRLDQLCEISGLSITSALTMIVSAGLAALERDNYRVTLPLKFSVGEHCGDGTTYSLNEPKPVEKPHRR